MANITVQADMRPFQEALLEVFGTEGREHHVVWELVGNGNRWARLDGKSIAVLTGDDPVGYKRRLEERKASMDAARAEGKSGGVVS